MTTDNILGAHHATLLAKVEDMRASADRRRMAGDTDAANLLRVANALRDVLEARGAYVHDNPDQLVLFQPQKEAA